MKKTILFTIGIVSAGISAMQAQITLTKTLPPIGSQILLKSVTSTISPATTGEAQTWNYSSAKFLNLAYYEIIELNTLNQTIQNKFPSSTYVQMLNVGAPDKNLNAMTFIEDRPDMLYQLGSQSSGGTIDNDASDTLFLFTHTFNTTLSYGRSLVKYAGYGSMVIDGKTFDTVVMHEYTNKKTGIVQHYFYTLTPYFQLLLACSIKNNAVSEAYYYQPVASATGLENDLSLGGKSVFYPNPTTDKLFLNERSKSDSYVIFNALGAEVEKGSISGNSINVSQLNNGVYHLQLSGNGTTSRTKFIKQ